jgi:hypothetical protein
MPSWQSSYCNRNTKRQKCHSKFTVRFGCVTGDCDMSNVRYKKRSVDVGIFCLSLVRNKYGGLYRERHIAS